MKELLYVIIDSIAYALSKFITWFQGDRHAQEIRRNTHLDGMLYDVCERYNVDRAIILQIKNGDVFYSGIHQHKLVATNEWASDGVVEVSDHFCEVNATMFTDQIKECLSLGFAQGATEDIKKYLERMTMLSIGVKHYAMLPIKHPQYDYSIGYLWIHNVKDAEIGSHTCLEMKEAAAFFSAYLTKKYGRSKKVS
jgi:hypothetical protein